MTTPYADGIEPTTTPVKPAPLWEDFIDILYAPSTVFERRRNQNPWPMILIITVLVTAITALTFNSLAPVFESEVRAQFAKVMAANPQLTQDMVETQVKVQMFFRRWGGVFYPIGALVMALPIWLLGRIVGAKELTYTRSLTVFTWSSIIGVISALVMAIQGLVMDVSTITTVDKLGLNAARLMDKATTSPWLYGALKTVDVFQIWGLIVMAIGVRVTGRGTKGSAIAFGVTWFLVGMLLVAAFTARAAAT